MSLPDPDNYRDGTERVIIIILRPHWSLHLQQKLLQV